ncbi:MAG: hypothetical protein ABUL62_30765 [Myxococcales bacterium]
MKSWVGLALVGVTFGLLTQSCGSSADKKKAPPGSGPDFGGSTGDGGDDGGGKGGASTGKAGANGSSGKSGGIIGSAGDDGSSLAGAGGESGAGTGGAGPDCPTGYGECDGDLTDLCEQSLTLVTSCGDCTTTCNSTHARASCVDQKCQFDCAAGYGDCDGKPNNGCEATLASNAENCGACGRDCSAVGATCMVDKCSAIAMQTNAPGGTDGSGNRTWAFSDLGLLHLGLYNYDLTRFPLDGTASKSIWTGLNKQTGNNSLLVVDDTVYWSEFGTGGNDFTATVFKKKITDPGATLPDTAFVPEWTVQFLRRQGNAMYWASGDYQSGDPGGYVYSRNLNAAASDPGTKIVSDNQGTHNGIVALDVTSNAIYWVTQFAGTGGTAYNLRTTPLTGGAYTVVPEVFANTGTPITASIVPTLRPKGNTIYFTHTTGGQDGIYSFKTGDAAPTKLVSAIGVTTMELDDDFIYYGQQNVTGLFKAPITGGAGVQIMSSSGVSRIIGQDAQFVYYIVSTCCASSVFKALK